MVEEKSPSLVVVARVTLRVAKLFWLLNIFMLAMIDNHVHYMCEPPTLPTPAGWSDIITALGSCVQR